MNKLLPLAVSVLVAASPVLAGTFQDTLKEHALNSTYWTVSQPQQAGLYTLTDGMAGVTLAQASGQNNTTGFTTIQVSLNLDNLLGNSNGLTGDFSTSIHFDRANIGNTTDNQVQLNTFMPGNGSTFSDVYDLSGSTPDVHVWDGSVQGLVGTSARLGTFEISRTGNVITGSFDGNSLFSEVDSSPVTVLTFSLQNQPGSNDDPSVIFGDFSLTADGVPNLSLPATRRVPDASDTLLLLGAGLLACAAVRKSGLASALSR